MIDRKQRYQGCLLGLAVGDALGTTLEFSEPGSFTPITDMHGGGPFKLKPGQWTDDTSMALCLAHSLVDNKGFNANDQMQRYCAWHSNGYMSSNGRCFDIGVTVSEALSQYIGSGNPYSGPTSPFTAGNGSIMRLAPVAMLYSPDLTQLLHFAGESSKTTHGAKECIDACRYFATLLHQALSGISKAQLFKRQLYKPTTRKVTAIQQSLRDTSPPAKLKGTGYVIDSLEAALWCFVQHDNFRDATLAAANLGNDADTTAAVCGQIAGACYGIEGIPQHWRERVVMSEDMIDLADRLYALSPSHQS